MRGTDKKTPKSDLVLEPGQFGIFTAGGSISGQRWDFGCYAQIVGHVETDQGWRYQAQRVWIEEPWIRGKTVNINPSHLQVVTRLAKTEEALREIPFEPAEIQAFKERSYYVRYPRVIFEADTYVVQADSPEEAARIARKRGFHLKKLDERSTCAWM